MAKLDDDYLKDIFSKLREYESPEKGMSWDSIIPNLGNGGLSRAVIMSLALLMVTVPLLLIFDFQEAANAEQSTVAAEGESKLAILENGNKKTVTHMLSNPVHSTYESLSIDREISKIDSATIIPPAPVQAQRQLSTNSFDDIDAFVVNEAVKKLKLKGETAPRFEVDGLMEHNIILDSVSREQRTRIGITTIVTPFYSFGIVKPLATDNVALQNYHFKPGYGFKTEILLAILRTERWTVQLGPSYQFMNKGFDYETTIYTPESKIQSATNRSMVNHSFGLSVHLVNENKGLILGTTLLRSIGTDGLADHLGSSTLYFQAVKEIDMKHNNLFLQIGFSAGAPLTGRFTTFKYYPIQLSVGLRKEWLLRK